MMGDHTRRDFLKVLAAVPFVPYLAGCSKTIKATEAEPGFPTAGVPLEPFNYRDVRLHEGLLKRQYDATRDYYFNIPDDDILKSFRLKAGLPAPGNDLGGWNLMEPYEHIGQWMSAMARMYRVSGDQAMLDKAVRLMSGWAETVERSDYFAKCRWPATPHYAFDKTAQGLIDLYEYGGQKDALPLLEKITDWASEHLDRTRKIPDTQDRDAKASEWYTLSENLYRAYLLTGDQRYRTFGDVWLYPTYWTTFGTAAPKAEVLHAYSHVNTLGSAMMAYAVTGDSAYLKAVIDAYDYFQRTQCFATGGFGPGEGLVAPDGSLGRSLETNEDSFETPCGSWAVLKLVRQMIRFTGEARFGDWMERIIYNGIGATLLMGPGGRTFYYSNYRMGSAQKAYHADPWPCCAGSYPLAVTEYHNVIYFSSPTGLYVNLYVPSEVRWRTGGQEIRVTQETDYPESDTSTLTIQTDKEARFDLNFRIPGWAQGANVKVNGRSVNAPARPGTWFTGTRPWRHGDQVVIQLPMRPTLAPVDVQHPNRVAITCGPVALVRIGETAPDLQGDDPSKWLVPGGPGMEFRGREGVGGTFVPFYRLGPGIPYGMYLEKGSG